MTHVKQANPTLNFVDHGEDPRIDYILADDPALVRKHQYQTELDFPWLLEFSANVLPGERLIEAQQASWMAFAVYIPKISTLIPFNVYGVGYQLGTNLIGETRQTRLNRLLGGRIFSHPGDNGIDKRKALALLRAFSVLPTQKSPPNSSPPPTDPDPGDSKPAAR